MRNLLIPSNAEELLAQADKMLDENQGSELTKKILAVQASLRGVQTNKISECFHVSERTVQIWNNMVKNKGFSALNRKRGSGRPKKLAKYQLEEINEWIYEDGPSYFGFDAQNWNGSLLSSVILSEFGIEITPRWCSNYIAKRMNRSSLTQEYLAVRYQNAQIGRQELIKLRNENEKLRKQNKELLNDNKKLRQKLSVQNKTK